MYNKKSSKKCIFLATDQHRRYYQAEACSIKSSATVKPRLRTRRLTDYSDAGDGPLFHQGVPRVSRSIACLALSCLVLTSLSSACADDGEDRAAAFVQKLGGTVQRDSKRPDNPVVGVALPRTRFTDADARELAAFKNLTALDLFLTEVTDAGVQELAAHKALIALDLGRTKVTDAGAKELAALTRLTKLELYETGVTDRGMKDLVTLKNLAWLDLGKTKVTDAGVRELAPLTALRTLKLHSTLITDAAVKE